MNEGVHFIQEDIANKWEAGETKRLQEEAEVKNASVQAQVNLLLSKRGGIQTRSPARENYKEPVLATINGA
jgi:hypothetical protein